MNVKSNGMTGEEIAKELSTTKQNVSNTLRRGLRKLYRGYEELEKNWTPFTIASNIAQSLHINTMTEMKKFIRMFPQELRKEIEEDAKKINNYLK